MLIGEFNISQRCLGCNIATIRNITIQTLGKRDTFSFEQELNSTTTLFFFSSLFFWVVWHSLPLNNFLPLKKEERLGEIVGILFLCFAYFLYVVFQHRGVYNWVNPSALSSAATIDFLSLPSSSSWWGWCELSKFPLQLLLLNSFGSVFAFIAFELREHKFSFALLLLPLFICIALLLPTLLLLVPAMLLWW